MGLAREIMEGFRELRLFLDELQATRGFCVLDLVLHHGGPQEEVPDVTYIMPIYG